MKGKSIKLAVVQADTRMDLNACQFLAVADKGMFGLYKDNSEYWFKAKFNF